jgi:hypothetical protein
MQDSFKFRLLVCFVWAGLFGLLTNPGLARPLPIIQP